jgi:hypothetical protein
VRRRFHSWQLALSGAFVGTCVGMLLLALPLVRAAEPPSALLGKGKMNGLQWQVRMHRDAQSRLACLVLGAELASEADDEMPSLFEVCSSVSAPVLLVTHVTRRKGKVVTVLGSILGPGVVRLELRSGNGRKVVPVVRQLSSRTSRRIGLPRLHYIRAVFPGDFCYTQSLGINESGRAIWSGASTCAG